MDDRGGHLAARNGKRHASGASSARSGDYRLV